MVWRLKRTERAESDLFDIWAYIAADNPAAADRQVTKLSDVFDATRDFPHSGRPTPEISPQHRVLTCGSYLLVCHIDDEAQTITLVRVLHGARDWLRLFGED